ncbi:MAG: PilN domain-containing protein [Cyanobacteriota bacterium]|jgi:type IV pilus assembly protein PilN|nr:PilN domain-containing protein [Cyanobacteriota bacterium]
MSSGDLDLLRERRTQLGLPEPDRGDPLVPLLQGSLVGGALVGLVLLAAGLLVLFNRSGSAELERLAPVQARSDQLQARVRAERNQRQTLEKASADLARALVAVRSGSALMEDLRRVAPQGVQFTDARVEGTMLRLKGQAADPRAFVRINALQLELQRSPLFDPGKVALVKASREASKADAQGQKGVAGPGAVEPVTFELTAAFREAGDADDLATLKRLGAEGMALRLQSLQRAGVLQ